MTCKIEMLIDNLEKGENNMELLEKITLYDLLGYTLPGGIMFYMVSGYDMQQKLTLFGLICYISFGFLFGILLSEFSAFVTEHLKGELCSLSDAGISKEIATKALNNAKVVENLNLTEEEIKKHFVNMYSDIQIDKNYGRIHNYASASLLYKNMVVVSFIGILHYAFCGNCTNVIIAFCSLGLFAHRWYRFEKKRFIYTINWYVKKYVTNVENNSSNI